jgi:uncharacterized protein
MTNPVKAALVLGGLIAIGLVGLAITAGRSALAVKGMERSVTVKGLAEREVPADLAVWPIRFAEAGNDLSQVYAALERNSARIVQFLTEQGFPMEEVSVAAPTVNDKLVRQYGNSGGVDLRYAASQAVTVRTSNIDLVRATIKRIAELGKTGIVFSGSEYQGQAEFLFTGLNALKPQMIEEATRSAREVAEKFAKDSASQLGKIRSANQGQFSVENLDSSTPHVKKVRVVSTVEYYLSD